MYARSCLVKLCIRVLSPRIEPPVIADEGSMARTATLLSGSVFKMCIPKDSMNVDFPDPGDPDIAILMVGAFIFMAGTFIFDE